MDELEQLDEGLGLDTITRAKKGEISKLKKEILKTGKELAALRSIIQKLGEERASSRAVLLEERRHIVTDIKAINTIAKNTITELKRDLSTGVRKNIIEVNKLGNQALRLGKELGQYNEIIESNKWLKGLLALVKGDEMEPEKVRGIGITVLHPMITWLDHHSQDSGISWLLRSSISNLIGELERWKV